MSAYSSADEAYDSDEPPELELDLAKLMDRASEALETRCTSAKKLTRGSSHEIFTLEFEDAPTAPASLAQAGYRCVARFARSPGNNDLSTAKSLSEIATARYLKRSTIIPVPEIYYHDLDPDNDIGAPFVLMERMPGRHLHKLWDGLSLHGKKSALSQIASVIRQLASLQFDQIGSLDEHGVGPLISPCNDQPKGPFQSTAEYLQSFVSPEAVDDKSYVQPPFCLIHADFDGQNMLFSDSPNGSGGPRLTGLIDFEYAHTGPLYYLYEYPIFIQDVDWSKDLYAENAVLRAHFVRAIYESLPTSEARSTFIAVMNEKGFALNGFRDMFMTIKCSEETLIDSATFYLQGLKDGTEPAYSGRPDYVPEMYTETGHPLPSATKEETTATQAAGGHGAHLCESQPPRNCGLDEARNFSMAADENSPTIEMENSLMTAEKEDLLTAGMETCQRLWPSTCQPERAKVPTFDHPEGIHCCF